MNEIPAEELTLTMIREAYPRELFRMLEGSGVVITEKYKGIYYLSGKVLFDTQKEPGERNNIDAVLQVSVSENAELFEKIRRDERMCQALRELMKDEIAEEIAKEVTKGRADEKLVDIKELMKNMKLTAEQAMNALGIPVADQSKYSAML